MKVGSEASRSTLLSMLVLLLLLLLFKLLLLLLLLPRFALPLGMKDNILFDVMVASFSNCFGMAEKKKVQNKEGVSTAGTEHKWKREEREHGYNTKKGNRFPETASRFSSVSPTMEIREEKMTWWKRWRSATEF